MLKYQVNVSYTYEIDPEDLASGASLEDMVRSQEPLIADLLHKALKEKKPGLKVNMAIVQELPATSSKEDVHAQA